MYHVFYLLLRHRKKSAVVPCPAVSDFASGRKLPATMKNYYMFAIADEPLLCARCLGRFAPPAREPSLSGSDQYDQVLTAQHIIRNPSLIAERKRS